MYSKKLQRLEGKAKRNFFFNELRGSSQDSRKTWSIINSLLHTKSDFHFAPSKICVNEQITSNFSKIATSFNDHFCSIGPNITFKLPLNDVNSVKDCLQNRVIPSIFLEKVTETEIMNYNSELKINKAGGYDEISSDFVKLSSFFLTPVLVPLVNSALSLGIFPDDLKLAKVVPIFKKGDKLDMNNYRPILLLTCLSKIFEKVIFHRLTDFLNEQSVLVFNQYGFRANRSTTHAILDIITEMYDNINSKLYSVLVTLDLTKAFDTVCHKRLLLKLDHYGIRGTALELISSYVTNRSQFVCINNVNCECKPVLMRVPQGSVLGPLLFLIYINDKQNSMESIPRLFADDTAILIKANSTSGVEIQRSEDLARVFIWMNKNQLTLNSLKSHALVISPLLNEEHNNNQH